MIEKVVSRRNLRKHRPHSRGLSALAEITCVAFCQFDGSRHARGGSYFNTATVPIFFIGVSNRPADPATTMATDFGFK